VSDRQLTLMAVHAHPDDEASGTGGVLARYAAEGLRTVLVTCTDGRCGDGPGGVKPGGPGHDPEAVAAARQAELEASCAILGVTDLELLGYPDSGMAGWSTNDVPGSFWTTPVEDAASRLVELIERYRPDVVVTYDPNGFYGHPDHVQAHRITTAALERSASTPKVYWTTMPHSAMAKFAEMAREAGMEFDEADLPADMPQIGLPDDEISTWVDVTAYADRKFAALGAHASQEETMPFLSMGLERFAGVMGVETFVRVDEKLDTAVRETDLFAGLR
jgi:LmbE family N-acetylglucosaminyl deacetylase